MLVTTASDIKASRVLLADELAVASTISMTSSTSSATCSTASEWVVVVDVAAVDDDQHRATVLKLGLK